MLRRFIKQSKVLIIVVLCFISNYCFGEFSNGPAQLPAVQFQSTSTMKTSYEVPALNQYGVANAPYQGTYSPRPRKNGLDPGPGGGGEVPGELPETPIGDIDILTILIMLGLWFIFKKYSRNKQNSNQKDHNSLRVIEKLKTHDY